MWVTCLAIHHRITEVQLRFVQRKNYFELEFSIAYFKCKLN